MPPGRVEWRAASDARLDVLVAGRVEGVSRSRAAALIRDGAVRVDGAVAHRPAHRVHEGQLVGVVVPEPAPDRAVPQDLPVDIVLEDDWLAVVNKPAGMVVHPSPGHPDGTLVNALLHHLGPLSGIGGVLRPGIVHRLDRGTSGLLVVAKCDAAHAGLAAQFAAHTAGRTYLALCHGPIEPDRGTARSMLARHPRDRVRWASTDGTHGKLAITHWEVLGRAGDAALVRCRLETGRTHQIRVHLTEAGWPLLGDPLYRRRGRRVPVELVGLVAPDRPLLHAWRLGFDHPVTDLRVELEVAPPDDFAAVLDALGLEI